MVGMTAAALMVILQQPSGARDALAPLERTPMSRREPTTQQPRTS
jgi:hypothetical protein